MPFNKHPASVHCVVRLLPFTLSCSSVVAWHLCIVLQPVFMLKNKRVAIGLCTCETVGQNAGPERAAVPQHSPAETKDVTLAQVELPSGAAGDDQFGGCRTVEHSYVKNKQIGEGTYGQVSLPAAPRVSRTQHTPARAPCLGGCHLPCKQLACPANVCNAGAAEACHQRHDTSGKALKRQVARTVCFS